MSYVTEDKIVVGRYFRFDRVEYEWNDVRAISTGCNPRGKNRTLRYNLHFSDGKVVDVENYRTQNRSIKKLDVLAEIDEHLRKLNVPWKPAKLTGGIYKGESLYDVDCFRQYAKRFNNEERETFFRVYRVE